MRHSRPTQDEIDAAIMESARAIPPGIQARLDAMMAETEEEEAVDDPAPPKARTPRRKRRGLPASRTSRQDLYPLATYIKQGNCYIQRDIYRAVKGAALLADVSLSAYINRALHERLEKDLPASRLPALR